VKVPPPLKVKWTMKGVSSAVTAHEELPGGQVEIRVDHELIRDVTPEMLVWWFRNFPSARLEHQGKLVQMYRIWHPRDHIRTRVVRRPLNRAPGYSKGARVLFSEAIAGRPIRMRAKVKQMDEGGVHLVVRRLLLFKVADIRHAFSAAERGTLCRTRHVIGSTLPLVGPLLTRVIRGRVFTDEMCRAWIRHHVEEIGNLQFILPKVYAQRHGAD
jgi:hypothetical protein